MINECSETPLQKIGIGTHKETIQLIKWLFTSWGVQLKYLEMNSLPEHDKEKQNEPNVQTWCPKEWLTWSPNEPKAEEEWSRQFD